MRQRDSSSGRPSGAAHLRVVEVVQANEQAAAPNADGRDGDPRTLDGAYRRYAPYVAAVAIRILGNDDELDDVVQDVFVDATRGIGSLREPGALKGWLARITVRTAVRRLRRRRVLRALLLERQAPDYEQLAAPDASPEERTQVAQVYRALDRLAAEERAAWVLRHVQGETLEAAAALCDCSLSTYQRRLRRAVERLQGALPHD